MNICSHEVVYADIESAPETIQLAPLTYYDELVPSYPPERWAALGLLPCRRLLPAGAPDAERRMPVPALTDRSE